MPINFPKKCLLSAMILPASLGYAQQDRVDEIVVTGSHIRGAQITEALPVTVLNSVDIDALGVNSGDELLEFLAEQGQNFFSEAENISGGVNSARGDIGAFNLRNVGTGNTLVLLNGRRMVNAAAYQTEEVGGSFVPVNTVNAQSLPVTGLQRAEVLKDGASALYGADAVAGVINYVLRNDFEGFRVRVRADDYESIGRNDQRITLEWGTNFNEGATNVGAFFNYYERDAVRARDDHRWAESDMRYRVKDPAFEAIFRNDTVNSQFGQYDVVRSVTGTGLSGRITDSAGEFETYPTGNANCQYQINAEVCGAIDGQGTYRYNLNSTRDLYSELQRANLYSYLTHEFDNGMELFSDFTWYYSDTFTARDPNTMLTAVTNFRMAADAYYNPLGPCGSPNRLPNSVIGASVPCAGLELGFDNYRWVQSPRGVNVDGDTFRFVGGLRGSVDAWDWEGAYTWSRADRHDITGGRISNILMTEAINDTTAAGFNPFAPYEGSNIERAMIDVTRDNEQELWMVDFKVSNNDIYELPAGPVGFVAGVEYRDESFLDDRDPRLDGQIVFTDLSGVSFPFVSDVMGSSPTSDSSGSRNVTSLFTELAIPVLDNLDVQLAARYEDFSDVGSTTVGKIAAGYRIFEPVLLRASFSEAFRAPNLVTINETLVARSNTRDDSGCLFVDPTQSVLDCSYGIQRTAQGSRLLEAEKSDNQSIGIVVEPLEGLTLTLDYWKIEKEDTIGLFGEENHITLDLLRRVESGAGNCGAVASNPAVNRESTVAAGALPLFTAAGICPFGEVIRVEDNYLNLDERILEGHDIGVYYEVETRFGSFDFRYVGSFLETFEQKAGGDAQELVAAQDSGRLPSNLPVVGFADLIKQNGNPERKETVRLSWDFNAWGVAATGVKYGGFHQVLSDGRNWNIDSMATYNLNADYSFQVFNLDSRVRVGINNVTDQRAPLADESFGYFADQHSDLGRYYYLDLQLDLF